MNSKSDSSNIEKRPKTCSNDTKSDKTENKVTQNLESKENIRQICDENITTLYKIHAILLNCKNLSETQKSEFAESERYFMKLHLKKLLKKLI
ncbi:MAG: hypothetical protein ACFFHD_12035 [Promethearchaeota archaeon]